MDMLNRAKHSRVIVELPNCVSVHQLRQRNYAGRYCYVRNTYRGIRSTGTVVIEVESCDHEPGLRQDGGDVSAIANKI